MRKTTFFLFLFLFSSLVHAEASSPDIPQIQEARKLIESGSPEEAYALLEPLELEQAGNLKYDYLLGISALNAGKASQAVFALERVQAIDSGYGDVGLWLAIAYFSSGDLERASAGFELLVSTSPNPETVASAKRYLAFISKTAGLPARGAQPAAGPGILGKVEVGLGYDDNISNISSNNPGTTQLANTLATPSSHLGGMESIINLSLEGRTRKTGDYLFVGVDEGLRKYRNNAVMNSKTFIAKGGLNLRSANGHVTRFILTRRQFRQEGHAEAITDIDNDYDISGLDANTRFKLSTQDYLGVIAQYNQLHFRKFAQEDTRQVMMGTNYMHVFQGGGRPVFYLGYTNVDDTAVRTKTAANPGYNDGLTVASRLSSNYFLYLQYSIASDLDVFSADYVNFRRDTGAYARDAVVAYGKDRTRYLSLGIDWRLKPGWTVLAEVANTANDSNIPVYSYRKTESRVILRREFSSL